MSRVRLVGVGPGHPGLATLQAVEAIKEADVIRNCDGCGTGLLHFAQPNADIAPLESVDEIVRFARNGRKVTVLFPGNPYAFSSGSEIAERLERAGVDFEAVPGLIVELAAPVMSGIPLTIEGLSASIGFGLATGGETVVLRLASGWWESGITALLVLGPGVDVAERLDTLSKRPLHGRRILITRARHQVDPFRRELVDLGAAVVEIPTLEIRRLPADARVSNAIKNLDRTALVIF